MTQRLFGRTGVLIASLAASSCGQPVPEPATNITIATGAAGGVFHAVGQALATAYSQKLPGLAAVPKISPNLEETLDALERGEIELAFDDSETTYVAYRKGTTADPKPHGRIRAIGVLFPTVVHIFARQASNIERVPDFRGKRISVGPRGSDSELVVRLILNSYGLEYHDIQAVFDPTAVAADGIRDGRLDAVVYYVPFKHRMIMEVTNEADVRLVPIERERIATIQEHSERSHFLKSTAIPKGTYRGQDRDILALGEDILLLCRDDLPESLIYDLTRTLFESVSDLIKAHPAAGSIDPDRGPMTSIPLHPGAARYYRERELPR